MQTMAVFVDFKPNFAIQKITKRQKRGFLNADKLSKGEIISYFKNNFRKKC